MVLPEFGHHQKAEGQERPKDGTRFYPYTLIVRKRWLRPPICFVAPLQFRPRFYDRFVDVSPRTWVIEGQEALFGGICDLKYRLSIDYQPTVGYVQRHLSALDDLHAGLQNSLVGSITAYVRRELHSIDPDGFASGSALGAAGAGIEAEVSGLLREQEIECQTFCVLKPETITFPQDSAEIIVYKGMLLQLERSKYDYLLELEEQRYVSKQRSRQLELASAEAGFNLEQRERELQIEKRREQIDHELRKQDIESERSIQTDNARRLSDVRFTAYYPNEVATQQWSTLLFYAHVPTLQKMVETDGRKRLGEQRVEYAASHSARTASILRGAEFTVIPRLEGCNFNPPIAKLLWLEEFHCIEFRFRMALNAQEGNKDEGASGSISVFIGPILIADLSFSIHCTARGQGGVLNEPLRVSTSPYERVFVSYSHADSFMVDRLEKAYTVLGLDYVRDIRALRSGEAWNEELLKKIELADIFQLCWSQNAQKSSNVEREWKHALALSRRQFVRPLYWETPMPEAPPELAPLHFAYLNWI